ncbi:MAG: hypothetical protein US50_C0015G0016 [Candidatus Nomurabacteria bacterium GW2011_GWB1_37_5]|uniref:Urease accessory protein UreH-like transmembrane domain-containing protein n=1 Tax=Candidatus Nomurabacteria bacterium GW2011_GWB1_37_5 TaxID=1618742 RepID=A0A0G0JF87_9BACT|nr:MAG: hypothetical protein US50_C0015G0016 [Candidatus Nomurabacteria bacterium GW2011_GWB1_37_5]
MNRTFFSKNKEDYVELLTAVGIVFILYVILKKSGILDFNFSFSDKPELPIVALIGLTAGISTCMALVGGLVLGVAARFSEKHPNSKPLEKFKPHLFFNLGRIIGFGIFGGIIGILGSLFTFSSSLYGLLIAFVAIIMLILGLKLIDIIPGIQRLGITLPIGIARKFNLHESKKHYSHTGTIIAGALTFFLPCGFTQAMQLYAVSTGNFIQGALIMSVFALGTTPGLLGIGGLSAWVKGSFGRHFYKFAGVVVIALGLLNLQGGLTLAGINLPKINFETRQNNNEAFIPEIIDGKQIVKIEQYAGGYYPNEITIKKNIPVKLIVTSTNTYTCASQMTIPKLGIYKNLKLGDNEIEFTPERTGPIVFTCTMGMFSGFFNVVD